MAVEIELDKMYFDFQAIIDGMQIKPLVTDSTLGGVSVVNSTFGPLNMHDLQSLLDQIFSEGRNSLNDILAKKTFMIPSKLFNLFELTDLQVKFHDGFVEAGLTPHFIFPETPVF